MFKTGLLIGLLALSGCATIISGSSVDVDIKSSPNKEKFVITDENNNVVSKGVTPATVNLKTGSGYFNGETYSVEFLDNKNNQTGFAILDSEINNWYFGNLIVGGFIGMVFVDPFTGAMWTLPDTVDVKVSK